MARSELQISPDEYFKDWFFDIPAYYWSIFGVKPGSWVDIEKSKVKRAELKKLYLLNGFTKAEAHKLSMDKGKVLRKGWGVSDADLFDFSEGYSIISSKGNVRIQIIENKDNQIVFTMYEESTQNIMGVYSVSDKNFVLFIKSGDDTFINVFDPRLLPESEFKYLLLNSLK